jgi:neutral ceramidase
MPKAGYSRTTRDGVGFRTRLRARVVHLRAQRSSIAVVALDLLGGSAVLQRLVARTIADRTDVPLAGLFLGATHTHAAPGQFCGSAMYNRYASNRPGFDPAWTQFLVDRISDAVIDAVEQRRPARVAIGSTDVWGFTRNRSLAPHLRNTDIDDRRRDADRKFAAVNPQLHLIRVDAAAASGGFDPLAALVVFSVHGTGISAGSRDYNADVWGYLNGALAHGVERATGHRIVVGSIEGTHADVAPALRPGHAGHIEAERIGSGIAAEALALYERLEPALRSDVALGCGLREVDLRAPGAMTVDGVTIAPARLGASQVAGAKENTTPVLHLVPPFRAGYPKPFAKKGPQGAKWILASERFQERVLPVADFPSVLPVHVLRIAGTTLVGLPFEVTVGSGRRIAAAVAAATGEVGDVVVSSVANEYWGYCTTEEEYSLQYYEGGHTLHGPNTQRFLAAHAARLAVEVTNQRDGFPISDVLAERQFSTAAHRYPPPANGTTASRVFAGRAEFHDPAGDDYGYWQVVWHDRAPGDLHWHEPLVRVEVRDGSGDWQPARHYERLVDDQDWQVSARALSDRRTGHRYAARWHDPWLGAGRAHRFVLLANNGQPELASEPFGPGERR